jgi:hypothetical protein
MQHQTNVQSIASTRVTRKIGRRLSGGICFDGIKTWSKAYFVTNTRDVQGCKLKLCRCTSWNKKIFVLAFSKARTRSLSLRLVAQGNITLAFHKHGTKTECQVLYYFKQNHCFKERTLHKHYSISWYKYWNGVTLFYLTLQPNTP